MENCLNSGNFYILITILNEDNLPLILELKKSKNSNSFDDLIETINYSKNIYDENNYSHLSMFYLGITCVDEANKRYVIEKNCLEGYTVCAQKLYSNKKIIIITNFTQEEKELKNILDKIVGKYLNYIFKPFLVENFTTAIFD